MIGRQIKSKWHWLDQLWFGPADSRVYAVLRVGFALVALLNLIDLWPHREAFFSEDGLISLDAARTQVANGPYFSVFFHIGSASAVTWIFVAAATAIVLLGLGVAPRTMIVLVFAWQLSYTYRALPIIHGWDIMLRIAAFLLMISPLGKEWNLFRLFSKSTRSAVIRRVPRYGLLLFQIQFAVIYWQTVWLKLSDAYWRNGEFISYFMLSIYSRIPHEFWAHQQLLSNALTFGTLAIEVFVPILLWRERTRIWGFALGWSLHLGITIFSEIWVFSIAMMMMYLAFLSGRDLDRIALKFRKN